MLELLLGGAIFVLFLVAIIGLALYLLMSFSLYTLANNKGLDYAWVAFIPVLQMFTVGRLVGTLKFQNYTIPFPAEWILLGTSVITISLSSSFINFIAYIIAILAYYNLYMIYKKDTAIVYTIIGAIVPVTIPFFLFSIRNNQPSEPETVSVIDDNNNNNITM